jgi:serine/threonine protein phosphatase PrpC
MRPDGTLSRLPHRSVPRSRGKRKPEPKSVAVDHPVTNLIETEGFVIASATDVGRKRSGNEDSHALWVSEDAAVRAKQGMLLVVCDGMGGASAGEVASKLAAETVVEVVRAGGFEDPADALREAIESANGAVHSQATANAEQRGMGTTCTAVLLRGREVWAGHVGDSRAYLVRGGKVMKLTKDHSLVAELIEKGHLTEAEAKHDHRRNVVTRSVGALDHVQVDAERVVDKLKPGDTIVICSDGLHGLVTDFEIGMIATEQAPAEACGSLIDLANERGGPDNITAIVVRLGGAAAASTDGAKAAEPAKAGSSEAAKEPGVKAPPNLRVLGGAAALMGILVIAVVAMLMSQLKGPKGGADAGAPATGGEPVAAAPESGTPAVGGAGAPAGKQAGAGTVTPPAEREAVSEPVPSAPPPVTPAKTAPAPPAPEKPKPAAPGRPGTVIFMTRPFQPSTFFVNGEFQAQDVGFLSTQLPAGDHVVRIEGQSGSSVEVPVHVEPGGTYSQVAELPHEGGLGSIQVAITGASHAQVLVDGANYPEQAPCVVRNLSAGSHTIRVRGQRGVLAQGPGEVTVEPGTTVRAEFKFGAGR